jgi:hypothetical protein
MCGMRVNTDRFKTARGVRPARVVGFLAYAAILLLGLVRAAGYLVSASFELRSPLEAFHFEAVMVHHAWRVAVGQPLYSGWERMPHVANFYGPVAFWLIGLLGRATGAGVDGLFTIGRTVSFGCGLATTACIAWVVGRSYGRQAGRIGGLLSLGAMPMVGFSVMVRPDLMAETLGCSGLVLALGQSPVGVPVGCGLLGLAVLTKQTAGMFLLAAAAALLIEGRPRRAAAVLTGSLAVVLAVALTVALSSEPGLISSLLGHSRLSPDLRHWRRVLWRLITLAPDLVVFPAVGLALWLRLKPREPAIAVAALVIVAASLATAVHPGSDQNYFLSLRLLEALAAGKLYRAWLDGRAPRVLALAMVVAAASLVPGAWLMVHQAYGAWQFDDMLHTTPGRASLDSLRQTFRVAEDPRVRLLTDSGMVALHQGDRADFVDPWIFRRLVTTGQLDPREIRDRLADEWYDLVVTTSDVLSPGYDAYEFGLPSPLTEEIRRHYAAAGYRAGLFFYRPRGDRTRPTAK